jgi:hypothetical protein
MYHPYYSEDDNKLAALFSCLLILGLQEAVHLWDMVFSPEKYRNKRVLEIYHAFILNFVVT